MNLLSLFFFPRNMNLFSSELISMLFQETKIDPDLPKQLLMVEFRSLTVSVPTKPKAGQAQQSGHAKNFKCFRKVRL